MTLVFHLHLIFGPPFKYLCKQAFNVGPTTEPVVFNMDVARRSLKKDNTAGVDHIPSYQSVYIYI